jgi:hypothetical protein
MHVWLAAPARPNTAATKATTMSLAGLLRMHDPHASRARRWASRGWADEGYGRVHEFLVGRTSKGRS